MIQAPILHVAIPAMNEADFLPATMECLMKQTINNFVVWVCVNQPDCWWENPQELEKCRNNLLTLDYLHNLNLPNLRILDYSSQGKGWKGKNTGVGQARKVLMEAINNVAHPNDIIVSLDADTRFDEGYLESVSSILFRHPQALGLSNPYYHKLSGIEPLDRAMLRYEIYMRHYAINMWIIESPFSFTALGSAIALPVWAYRKIGGMTPKKSGEDFYLLQKLRKTGWLLNHNSQYVFPGTRFSDRVFFGTGPALIKGSQGNWSSYPLYHHALFQNIKKTFDLYPDLFQQSLLTPMSAFLNEQFRDEDIFEALRINSKTAEQFIKACHHKVDGLRILQYLKISQQEVQFRDEENLRDFFEHFFNSHLEEFKLKSTRKFPPELKLSKDKGYPPDNLSLILNDSSHLQDFLELLKDLDFQKTSIDTLDFIRNLQSNIEEQYQLMDLPNASH